MINKLSFLDKEYLHAFIEGDTARMRKLRRTSASVVVPYGSVKFCENRSRGQYSSDLSYEQIVKYERQHAYRERRDSQKQIAKYMLAGTWKGKRIEENEVII